MVELVSEPTSVPLAGGRDVELSPHDPWPSAYRGSKYSVIQSPKHGVVMSWQYDDLLTYFEVPDGLVDALSAVNKSDGTGLGSVRFTAGGEVLTKVHASSYPRPQAAHSDSGWIPVYLGQLSDTFDPEDIRLDPSPERADPIAVWDGYPFDHGETWTVKLDETLVWRWEGYEFESAFDHSELVSRYAEFRETPGRLYVNENGHVWVNIGSSEVPEGHSETFQQAFNMWETEAEEHGRNAARKLVTRRLEATGEGDASEGLLPVYIGHISEFDGGAVPRPVVDDMRYFHEVEK